MTPALIIIILTIIQLGGALWVFYWFSIRPMKETVQALQGQMEKQDQALESLSQRTRNLGNMSRRYEESFQRIAGVVDSVSVLQDKQSLELKQLHRREKAALRQGLAPRAPELIPVPELKKRTLQPGPKTPTPRAV